MVHWVRIADQIEISFYIVRSDLENTTEQQYRQCERKDREGKTLQWAVPDLFRMYIPSPLVTSSHDIKQSWWVSPIDPEHLQGPYSGLLQRFEKKEEIHVRNEAKTGNPEIAWHNDPFCGIRNITPLKEALVVERNYRTQLFYTKIGSLINRSILYE